MMSDLLWNQILNWAPLVVFLAVWLFFSKYSKQSYSGYIDRVEKINSEIADLARKTHALTEEQLSVLKQIKSLLEDRKS